MTFSNSHEILAILDGDVQTCEVLAVAFDSWGIPFATLQNYGDGFDLSIVCHMTLNDNDEFSGQGGYSNLDDAIEAVEFIAKNGCAPTGFYAM